MFSQVLPGFQPKHQVPYLAHALKQTRAHIIVEHSLRQGFTKIAQCLLEETKLKKQRKKIPKCADLTKTEEFLLSFILGYVVRKENHPGIRWFCNSYYTVRRCWSLIQLDIIYTNRNLLVWSLSPLLQKCNRSYGIKKVFLSVLLKTEQKLWLPGLCQSCSISIIEYLNTMKLGRVSRMGAAWGASTTGMKHSSVSGKPILCVSTTMVPSGYRKRKAPEH